MRVLPGGEPGDYQQGVSVTLHCGTASRSSVFLRLGWSVRPQLEASPSRLWLGLCGPGQVVDREVTVCSNDGLSFRVAGVSCNAQGLLQSSRMDDAAGTLQSVRLRFSVGTNPGLRRAMLSFQLAGQSSATISLPVSYLVKEHSGAATGVAKP